MLHASHPLTDHVILLPCPATGQLAVHQSQLPVFKPVLH